MTVGRPVDGFASSQVANCITLVGPRAVRADKPGPPLRALGSAFAPPRHATPRARPAPAPAPACRRQLDQHRVNQRCRCLKAPAQQQQLLATVPHHVFCLISGLPTDRPANIPTHMPLEAPAPAARLRDAAPYVKSHHRPPFDKPRSDRAANTKTSRVSSAPLMFLSEWLTSRLHFSASQ